MSHNLDLTEAIYGTPYLEGELDSLQEGERISLLLFQAGSTAMKPTIEVDTVRISELGVHLEEFTGRDVTDPIFDDGLSPGSIISGMYNHITSVVFITSLDGEQVAQEPEFYNANPPTDK